MGEKLLGYYKYVTEVAGMDGKIKLAQLTKVPSAIAAEQPDSPSNVELFQSAVATITGKPVPRL
jgi:hypothetical protein